MADSAKGFAPVVLVRCGAERDDSIQARLCGIADSVYHGFAEKQDRQRAILDSSALVVVPPRYDVVLELAAARGCIPVNVGGRVETWGRSLTGGAWGLIDTTGRGDSMKDSRRCAVRGCGG